MYLFITTVVLNLLIINSLVFLATSLHENWLQYFLLFKTDLFGIRENLHLSAYGPDLFEPIQLVTYFFSHANFFHLLFNSLALVSIGSMVEVSMGVRKFLQFYLFVGIMGGILITFFDPSPNPVLGASVPISGVLVGFGYYYPDRSLFIFPIPFPIKSRTLVAGFIGISFLMVLINEQSGISHFGHLVGALLGLLYFLVMPNKAKNKIY